MGANESPFLRSCNSCGLSDCEVRLCMPMLGLAVVQKSSIFSCFVAVELCLFILLWCVLCTYNMGSYLHMFSVYLLA